MNLHALRIFVEVASRGSVTEAAIALSISQPAVSAQIRKLESELGMTLLIPNGRGISLTYEGRFLFEKARRIYDWEREIESQLTEIKQGKKGRLRIASTYLPSHYLVPQWLAQYKRDYEGVDVEIRTRNSMQSIELLLGCEVDVAVIIKESWDELPIKRLHLMDVSYWFILPAHHPLAGKEIRMEQLVEEPFLLREQGSSTRDWLFALCREHGVKRPQVGMQYHGLVESIHSVRAGYGTMLAPALAVREMVERGEVGRVTVPGVEIKRPLYVCTRDGETEQRPVVAQFLELVKRERSS
ncbi:LysR family transcriptional regulator [Brevibacillus brevis]|uniref:LysR family transcriptional regulator n=1 Tax=Brevibacillus brevis TaxID=1393 RepID=UPI000D0EB003|nr:LysR family transcriptional regulator [Brevibacillus brevis]PSJ67086.1 LysR family transcriptional regulator [Brevibacillus brevis]RED25651.1 DNA-binding transcriptional LysR family regulator [Brevibacillus brevis]GEC90213.1 LysR family transcriptional regulator [Brevibacillus brevis]VEF87118.1 HTH-type transcriptional activator CmpR [Brevibacillus brevis]